MQVIKLPQWLIENIDRIRRAFLWRGNKKCLGGHCLVNWSRCCLLKQNGGLDIHDLKIQNEALLAKWVWALMTQPTSGWKSTILSIYGSTQITDLLQHPLVSNQLRDILQTYKFVRHAVVVAPDGSLIWNWSSQGSYSVSKAYKRMMHTGVISASYNYPWKLKAPAKIKTFIWLLLQDRLLTQANLQLRGWPAQQACVLCSTQHIEDAAHLFQNCQFASVIWQTIGILFNLTINLSFQEMTDFWLQNRMTFDMEKKDSWDIVWSATCWTLWKLRCKVIFQNENPSLHKTIFEVETLVRNWASAWGLLATGRLAFEKDVNLDKSGRMSTVTYS
ncbi:hypothetical protein LUZ63_019789 [Rhynchospora breviuscula]|uniref:Reverse transcriptase zinc-binding domain-containing protein n=1 Tax=Rhynchospora breviuscula TaxID=2022672 RepID=A0A9Q0C750_9POAL|nr:hypothetical protein LUZ63_019789 [Rhynchospora breviuscula]